MFQINDDIKLFCNSLIQESHSCITTNFCGKNIQINSSTIFVNSIIAEGSFGIVYKCSGIKELALKKSAVNSWDKLSRCFVEIYLLKHLRNDYILQYEGAVLYRNSNNIYDILILTEYCQDNLSNLFNRNQSYKSNLSENIIGKILLQITDALYCCHSSLNFPVIHRDVKIENILIRNGVNYVLCDFGSATIQEVRPCDVVRDVLQEEIANYTTLAYRAPEMIDLYANKGQNIIGRKSDIWALGVVIYTLCFSKLPFGENSCLGIMTAGFGIPDSYTCSQRLLKLIKYMLTPEPDLRPDSHKLLELTRALVHLNNTKSLEEIDSLELPLTESEISQIEMEKSHRHKSKPTSTNLLHKPISTSIAPRERRKPNRTVSNLTASYQTTMMPSSNQQPIENLEANTTSPTNENSKNGNLIDLDKDISSSTSCLGDDLNWEQLIKGPQSNTNSESINSFMPQESYQTSNNSIPNQYQQNNPLFGMNNIVNSGFGVQYNMYTPQSIQSNHGHRRLVSDSCVNFTRINATPTFGESLHPAQQILQPQKLKIPSKPLDLKLEDFDPLNS